MGNPRKSENNIRLTHACVMGQLITAWSLKLCAALQTDLQSALSHQANDVPPVLQPQRVQPRLCDHTLGSSHHVGPILWSLCMSHQCLFTHLVTHLVTHQHLTH